MLYLEPFNYKVTVIRILRVCNSPLLQRQSPGFGRRGKCIDCIVWLGWVGDRATHIAITRSKCDDFVCIDGIYHGIAIPIEVEALNQMAAGLIQVSANSTGRAVPFVASTQLNSEAAPAIHRTAHKVVEYRIQAEILHHVLV